MADDEPSAAMQELRRRIVEIERDTTLSAAEKAVRRQQVMSAGFAPKAAAAPKEKASAAADAKGVCCRCSRVCLRRALGASAVALACASALACTGWSDVFRAFAGKGAAGPESTLAMIDEALKCAFCFNLCERPVTVRAPPALPPCGA